MPRIPRRWKDGEQAQADPAASETSSGDEQPTSVLEPEAASGGDAEVVAGHEATAQGAVSSPETAVDSAAMAAGEAAVRSGDPLAPTPPPEAGAVTGDPLAPTPPAGAVAVSGDPLAAGATGETIVAPGGAVSADAPEAAPVLEHAPPDATPRFRERSRMRRRLRYLRRRRELAFRDLGGLVFDLHRFGRDRSDLVAQKLEGLGAIDGELRTLEAALHERRELTELREAGIAACPRCQTLHDTDANFCPGCGAALRGTAIRDAAPVTVAPADEQPQQPTPAPS